MRTNSYIFGLVVSFVLGFLLSGLTIFSLVYISPGEFSRGERISEGEYERGFEDGFEHIRERVRSLDYHYWPDYTYPIYEMSGTILSVEENKVNIKITNPSPFVDPELDYRSINIGDETIFYVLIEKRYDIYRMEIEEYERRLANGEFIDYPQFYDEIVGGFEDLRVGQTILFSSNYDLRYETSFDVFEIKIYNLLI